MYTTRLGQFIFSFPNTQEFHALKREIYSQHSYYLENDLTAPYIIDAGAHIGMSVAYFKSLWPDATILAIEPNPQSLEYLHHNIEQNQLSRVQVEPVALATHAGMTLHVRLLAGGNSHHIIEAVFKALGRALGEAVRLDPRRGGVPSTKGVL